MSIAAKPTLTRSRYAITYSKNRKGMSRHRALRRAERETSSVNLQILHQKTPFRCQAPIHDERNLAVRASVDSRSHGKTVAGFAICGPGAVEGSQLRPHHDRDAGVVP